MGPSSLVALLKFCSVLCIIILLVQYVDGSSVLKEEQVPVDGTSIACEYEKGGEEVICAGETFASESRATGWMLVIDIALSLFCVFFAGAMSGLTMGLMSLDITNLRIIAKSGDPTQRKHAKRIMPLVAKHHWLLVTLLCANAMAMEALPLFLDRIVGPAAAILISVTMVLFFGEIIPQAICTRYGLAIGSYASPIVWLLIILFSPIGWPLGKLLDCILGHEAGTFYRRAELKELVGIHENSPLLSGEHQTEEEGRERLTRDEVNIIKGAIDLRSKTVSSAMTPMERVAVISFDQVLDRGTCERLVREGHSRWPVYRGEKNNIIGMILIKSLVLVDPKDNLQVKELEIRKLPVVNEEMPLYNILDLFQQGKSHMAMVLDQTDCITCKGIITLEDVVEELIGEEIIDETDVFEDIAQQVRVVRAFKNELQRTESQESITTPSAFDEQMTPTPLYLQTE